MAGVQEQGFFVLASTNDPEKINPALLQPQRLGIRVYCGLPSEQARMHILSMHSPFSTTESEVPLFSHVEARDMILNYVSKQADSFPPRQLGKIATNAKAILLERRAARTGKTRGLTEDDLEGDYFTVDDWELALNATLEIFDRAGVIARDRQIREFIIHNQKRQTGLVPSEHGQRISLDEVRRQIAALEAGKIVS